ncbi:Hint domain-containing protein [Phaeobacter sp. CNT1-3]|nr:Hint domain-containing protein [Phaeobacter sp. CNT1-3]
MADLVLDWSLFGTYNSALTGASTADTGGVAVSVNYTGFDDGAEAFIMNLDGYVAEDDPFNPNSHLKLLGNGGDEQGTSATSTVELSFASTDERFGDTVQNVSFRLNDIDAGTDPFNEGGTHLDGIEIVAFDADGNEVAVTLTPGAAVDSAGGVLSGDGGPFTPTDAEASALVEIAGPVARLEIRYTNGGDDEQRAFISDVHFSTVDTEVDPTRDGIVWGTDDDDLIDLGYDGDNDGDFVDAGDNIFPENGPEDDIIRAGDGDDTVYAGEGDDDITGGDGADSIFGEDGSDLIVSGPDALDGALPDLGYPGLYPADEDPENDRDFVDGGNGADTIRTGDDADTILGGEGADLIDGGIDADEIDGGLGRDTIVGGEGSDTIYGGSGHDLIYGGLTPDVPDAVNIPDDRDLVPENGQDLIFAGSGNDTVFGADDDDTIYGGSGNDLLDGQIDEDEIYGGGGNDTLRGGDGNDTLTGGNGDDSISGGADRDLIIGANAGDVIEGGSAGDDFDTLDLSDVGRFRLTDVVTDSDGNGFDGTVEFLDSDGDVTGTASFTNIEDIVPCFTPGSLIATPQGQRRVEDLQEGDKVITRDNGIQEIRWVGHKRMNGIDLARQPQLQPVLIRKGSLGNDLPERDIMVSPNHRVLVTNEKVSLYFNETEVLASAKHLVGLDGIHKVNVVGTTYIHFMFDRHEVVLSDGAWSESFHPGDYTLKGIGRDQREEILTLFPELKEQKGLDSYHAARRSLKKHEAQILTLKR